MGLVKNGSVQIERLKFAAANWVPSVLSVNYHPSDGVISIKSQLCIPSAKNNFPPVVSAPAEGTQFAAANFNLSFTKTL